MKNLLKYLLLTTAVTGITLLSSSCYRQNYVMYEDGDFDGAEFTDYDLIHNAELDMDDMDRY
ncbi:MAG: hypothetical protein IKZ92_08025 [Muribaculaceae bacterium]|nr:hypothetical protein [Muribaculaceae bacterium]